MRTPETTIVRAPDSGPMTGLGRLCTVGVALLVVTMGCIGATEDGTQEDLQTASEGPALGVNSSLDTQRDGSTLDATPSWALGEWWTYSIESSDYQTEGTFTVVVAGEDADHYLVGLPADEDEVLGFIFHIPGIGKVAKEDLVYDAHDAPFQLLDFPLEEGKSWSSIYWNGSQMDVAVESVDGTEASMSVTQSTDTGETVGSLVYDAELGNIVSFQPSEDPGYELELVDHGFGYEGPVEVPYEQDLLLCHGALAGAAAVDGCQIGAGSPQGTFTIPDGYDDVTGALLATPLETADGTAPPGAYRIDVTDPHDETHQLEMMPAEAGKLAPLHVEDPAGEWSYTALAGGPGAVLVEGVAHRTLEVTLG